MLRRRRWFQGRPLRGEGVSDIAWFSPEGKEMSDADWQVSFAKSLGMFLNGAELPSYVLRYGERIEDDSFFLILNAYWEPIDFVLPDGRFANHWSLVLDTARDDPFPVPGETTVVAGSSIAVEGRALVLLSAAA